MLPADTAQADQRRCRCQAAFVFERNIIGKTATDLFGGQRPGQRSVVNVSSGGLRASFRKCVAHIAPASHALVTTSDNYRSGMRTGTARCICCKHSLPLTRTPSTNHCQHTDLRAHGKLFPQLPAVCCQEQRNTLTHYVSQHRHKQRGSIFSRRRQGLTACTCAQRQMELAPQEPAHTQSRTLKYTPYEGNSWQVTFPQSGTTARCYPRSSVKHNPECPSTLVRCYCSC